LKTVDFWAILNNIHPALSRIKSVSDAQQAINEKASNYENIQRTSYVSL
jgi:hypothetical protein